MRHPTLSHSSSHSWRAPTILLCAFGLVAAAPALLPRAAWAAGGAPVLEVEIPRDPEQIAAGHYNRALESLDRAAKLEARAASERSSARLRKLRSRVEVQYRDAIRELRVAVTHHARFHQAYGSLGYALRKTGDLEGALTAYDRSLELAPEYAPALEYRGEAYLGLGRLEDAKGAYLELFNLDRELADRLLTAMGDWVESRRTDPGELPPAAVEELAEWVEQRKQLASQTAALGADAPPRRDGAGGW